MNRRRCGFVSSLMAACFLTTIGHAQIPGPNVNMVSGTKWPDGDPFLQRQNEPSLAVSTRNPLHLVGGANDYRTVDIPGLVDGEETGDAWLGLFKSFDGGRTWKSTLLPGCPEAIPQCDGAPAIKGMQAGADPTVRAGTNGLFYYSGLAFNRGDGGASAIFVSRLIDNNNKENGDPIAFLGTSVVHSGNATISLDKPSLAVDVPREDAGVCQISSGGTVQMIRAGTVYVAYTAFLGTQGSPDFRARVMAARSLDCGQTWSRPVNISEEQRVSQSAAIAIDPRTGAVYVAWRRFMTAKQNDAIMIAKADADDFEFSDPVVVSRLVPFDQGMSGVTFRTNSYPTLAVDGDGRVYVAWADRIIAGGTARILLSVSAHGRTWSAPSGVDSSASAGHQIMPALVFAGGRLTLTYYDLRDDSTVGVFTLLNQQWIETRVAVGDLAPPNPNPLNVFNPWIMDASPPGSLTPLVRRHTIDVRVAQALPGPNPSFGASQRVTRYAFGNTAPGLPIDQFQFDPPDLPLFKKGTAPFVGDYIDVAAAPAFVMGARGKWIYNLAPSDQIVYHATWADNRDVRPPPINPATGKPDWTLYTPPNSDSNNGISKFDGSVLAACVATSTGSRNQNIYTSSISQGLIVSALNNTKPLSTTLERTFPVTVQNTTSVVAAYRLQIANQPAGGKASFLQFPVVGLPDPLTQVDVLIAPKSSISRTVFVTSTNPHAQVTVTATQITAPAGQPIANGLTGSVLLNPDIENPDIENPDIENTNPNNPSVLAAEVLNPDIENPDIENTAIPNPDIENPDIENPDIENINVMNPDIENPNVSNPDIENPDIENPDIENPDVSSGDLVNGASADAQWTITNRGNTSASYNTKLFATLPAAFKSQLVLYKTYVTPVAQGCSLKLQTQNVVIANIPAPVFTSLDALFSQDVTDPSLTNTSMTLGPGQSAKIALRVVNPNRYAGPQLCMGGQTTGCVDLKSSVAVVVIPQAANTGQIQPTITVSGPPVITTMSPLPLAVVGSLYTLQLIAAGGTASLVWTGQNLPAGMFLSPAGVLTGTPQATGEFNFIATVTDQSSRSTSRTLTLPVSASPVLALAASSLPNATFGTAYNQTLTATGGTAPYAFGLVLGSGPLPPGMTLDGNGLLSGTPTGLGAYGFTVAVVDSAGHTQTFALSIVVGAASGSSLAFLSPLPNIVVGQSLGVIQVLAHTPTNVPIPGVPVTLTLGNSNPSGGRLTGNTTAVTDTTGVATFTGISVDRIGSYNLTATVLGIVPSGSFQLVPAPSSIAQGVLENDTLISVFPEKWGVSLAWPVSVNASVSGSYNSFGSLKPSFIAAGTVVDSYYLHADPVGQPTTPRFQSATFTFPTPILGVEIFEPQLGSGDALVGAPGTQYAPGRDYEIGSPQDSFVISPDGRTLSVNTSNTVATDDMRVIIATGQASTHIAAGTSAAFTVGAVPGLISTYAGRSLAFRMPESGQATSASFAGLTMNTLDGAGNLYFADSDLNQVFKVTPGGALSVVAGSGGTGFSGDGGPATNATLNRPYGVAVDSLGNVYIAELVNAAIRKVDAISGIITTIAGGGPYNGDNIPALESSFGNLVGLAFDPLHPSNLYFADFGASLVRKIDLNTGIVYTIAGTGTPGYNGDNITATTAQLRNPWGLAFDGAGNLYISDSNNFRVREVSAGIITTVAGTGVSGYSPDGGPATAAALGCPTSLSFDAAGELFIGDNCVNRIRKVSDGTITTVAGNGTPGISGDGGPATSASLWGAAGVTADVEGNLYISGEQRIRKVTGTTISTYAGNGSLLFSGDGGPATSATLNPRGLALDSAGNLYVADQFNGRVRRITPGGTIDTYAGNGNLSGPAGDGGLATSAVVFTGTVAVDGGGNLYVVDNARIRKITPDGIIAPVAGSGAFGYGGDDGPALKASISPTAVAVDATGNLYISEYSSRVRKVDTLGIITTVAGNGTPGFSGDNGLATSAQLANPQWVAVDTAGNLYITDQGNARIRRVTPGGIITTVAGNGTFGFTPDGGSALGPIAPAGITVDVAGNLYVTSASRRVQKVDIAGTISTVAGNGVFGFAGDGAPAKEGSVEGFSGITADPNGNVYFSDTADYRVRMVSGGGPLAPASRLTIITTNLSASINAPFNTALSAVGGTGSLTWSLAGDSLPAELSMDAAGNITGTPVVAGTFNALVQLTDSGTPQQTTSGYVQIVVQIVGQ